MAAVAAAVVVVVVSVVDAVVGDTVGAADGGTVGLAVVGRAVGGAVGDTEGGFVGGAVGDTVVGGTVGAADGGTVGLAVVGRAVGLAVGVGNSASTAASNAGWSITFSTNGRVLASLPSIVRPEVPGPHIPQLPPQWPLQTCLSASQLLAPQAAHPWTPMCSSAARPNGVPARFIENGDDKPPRQSAPVPQLSRV